MLGAVGGALAEVPSLTSRKPGTVGTLGILALRKWSQEEQGVKVILDCTANRKPAWATEDSVSHAGLRASRVPDPGVTEL